MARHGFGRGEYKYFSFPLPGIIAKLRTVLHAHLAPVANRSNAAMGIDGGYPEKRADFLRRCHNAGQVLPTPLLLQYGVLSLSLLARITQHRQGMETQPGPADLGQSVFEWQHHTPRIPNSLASVARMNPEPSIESGCWR